MSPLGWYVALIAVEVVGIVALDRSRDIERYLERRRVRRDFRAVARWSKW